MPGEVDVGNSAAKSFSISFFISAVLLALFGVAALNTSHTNGMAQLALSAVMVGAGLFLLGGTAESRILGLAAAAVTIAFGAFELMTGRGYVPGTIVAVFVFARLAGAAAAFGPATTGGYQPMPAYPQQPYGAPMAYPAPPQQPSAQYGYVGPPPAGPAVPLTGPTAPPDSRFG